MLVSEEDPKEAQAVVRGLEKRGGEGHLVRVVRTDCPEPPNRCATQKPVLVYCEHIKRLSALGKLTDSEAYEMLRGAALGYQELSAKNAFAYEVTADMIGLNDRQKTKVWFSDKFSDSSPALFLRLQEEHKFTEGLLRVFEPHYAAMPQFREAFLRRFGKDMTLRNLVSFVEEQDSQLFGRLEESHPHHLSPLEEVSPRLDRLELHYPYRQDTPLQYLNTTFQPIIS